MPMLAETGTCRLPIRSGDASASVMFEATSEARAGSQFGSTITNSSPPGAPACPTGLDRARSRSRQLDQQGVADRMSQRIVDVLEMIEVEKHQGDLFCARDKSAMAWLISSRNCARFGSPVSMS